MKGLTVSLALTFLSVIASAAPQIIGFPRKDLEQENRRLRQKIDSLESVLDSIRRSSAVSPETYTFPSQDTLVDIPSFSAEETDSLMNLWYNSRRMNTFRELGDYEADSVKFTSNVPDSVLVARLASMNPFITLPFNETVKNYMVLYSEKMPSRMRRMLGLSSYYFPIFEEAFSRYDIPLELKYMAIIESGLNPTAQSWAGARGMWQFMYHTGRSYGLDIDSFVDERLDPVKSVDAAARFLRDSYRVFGDWNLAISSYNCGAGNVQKAIRRAGSREFWDIYPYLPRETRGYVPAFVGAMYAMTYYREYGLVPDDVGMPAVTDTFHISRNLHFKQIDEVAGIPVDVIKEYNPQYTHDIIPGSGRVSVLRLPYTWTNQFLDADPDSLYLHRSGELISQQVIKNIEESGQETRIAHRVRSGEYLGRIASRYHVTVSQIMKWNHLRSSNLRVGQVLYIYRKGPAVVSSASMPAAATSTETVYTVRQGDTFYGIAKKFPGRSAQSIMNYNGLKSPSLHPGMKIKIPSAK